MMAMMEVEKRNHQKNKQYERTLCPMVMTEMALKQQQKVFLIPKFVFQAKDKDEVSCTFS
jgi:hypothetical protein